MSIEFDTAAAESRKKIAERAAAANDGKSAASNYKLAAGYYRKAAVGDEANKSKWIQEAEECGRLAEYYASQGQSLAAASRPAADKGDGARKAVKSAPAAKNASETKAEKKPKPSLEESLAKLNELIGLKNVKEQINSWIATVTINKERKAMGLPVAAMSYHMVFNGNPGTGKTTVARIIADIYYALGLVSGGQLVECKANDLVAGYVGQTAIKTQKVIDKAIGGVLFIDEAYTLNSNSFGQEAIDTLLKAMEDHREELVVVVAGYEGLMEKFIDSNPGLKSRFKTYVKFEDYDGKELYQIFLTLCNKNRYVLDDGLAGVVKEYFAEYYKNRGENFGNARDVRNIFENTLAKMNVRLQKTSARSYEDLTLITRADLPW